jgi:hypothetical protein
MRFSLHRDQLDKEIEESRPARRLRALQTAVIPTEPEPAAVRRPRVARETSDVTIAVIEREIETGIADAIADFPELEEDQVAHEIAWSILAMHPDVAQNVRSVIENRYGISGWLSAVEG